MKAWCSSQRGSPAAAPLVTGATPGATDDSTTMRVARYWAWADLMRRAVDVDVLACLRCGGRLRLIATVEDPDAIRAILAAVAASQKFAGRAPPFGPALNTGHPSAIWA